MGKGGRPLSELSIRLLKATLVEPLTSRELADLTGESIDAVWKCLERLRLDKHFVGAVQTIRVDHCKKPVRLYATTTAGLQYLQGLDEIGDVKPYQRLSHGRRGTT